MDKSQEFRTEFAESIFNHKYKHENCETWAKLSKTLVNHVCEKHLSENEINELVNYHSEMKFIAGGRYLYYAGRESPFFNNCYLLKSSEDSREDWADLSWKAESCLMTGGGVGNDYSIYRAKGSVLSKTGGYASGPISKMKMINEIGREVMQGGSRRCLPHYSKIHTKLGLKNIEDINTNDEVLTFKGYEKVLNVFNQGEQKTIIIKTQLGNLECTPNHKVAVLNSIGVYDWVEAQNLKENDRLIFSSIGIEGQNTKLPDFNYIKPKGSSTCKDIIIPELDGDIAYLFGIIAGDGYVFVNKSDKKVKDGCVARRGRVSIACSNDYPEIIDKVVNIFRRFGVDPKIKAGDGDLVNVVAYSYQLALYFSQWKEPNKEIVIPDFIYNGSFDVRGGYLAGLLDSDGCVKNRPVKLVSSVYYEFIKSVQILYHSLGIPVRLKWKERPEINWKAIGELCLVGKTAYTGFINIIQKFAVKKVRTDNSFGQYDYTIPSFMLPVGFKGTIDRSIEKVNEHLNIDTTYLPIKVISISEGKIVKTYDIEVENRNEFICEGYLVHNSALYASLNWQHQDIGEFLHCKDWYSMPVSGAYDENNNNLTVGLLKEKDFNYHAPLDMTNISLNYDNEFLEQIYMIPFDELKEIYRLGGKDAIFELPVKNIPLTFLENCRQALKTGEPGFSFNFFEKVLETLRNACCEVCSEDDSDVCNLASVNMANIETIEEFRNVCYQVSKFLLCGTLEAELPYNKVYNTRAKNRRLGLGLMGVHEWLLKRGYRYEVTQELKDWLQVYKDYSEIGANELAEKLSINKPVAYRAIAPTGTIGILAGTTTGIEPLFAVAYKRRYLKGKKEWHYQYVIDGTAKILIDRYNIKPEDIETALSLSEDYERRIKFQADIQDYVDMSISSTINLPKWGTELNNDTRVEDFAHVLAKYAIRLRGFTCYPDGARGGQPLNIVDYYEALKHEGQEFKEQFHDICEISSKGGVCGS